MTVIRQISSHCGSGTAPEQVIKLNGNSRLRRTGQFKVHRLEILSLLIDNHSTGTQIQIRNHLKRQTIHPRNPADEWTPWNHTLAALEWNFHFRHTNKQSSLSIPGQSIEYPSRQVPLLSTRSTEIPICDLEHSKYSTDWSAATDYEWTHLSVGNDRLGSNLLSPAVILLATAGRGEADSRISLSSDGNEN